MQCNKRSRSDQAKRIYFPPFFLSLTFPHSLSLLHYFWFHPGLASYVGQLEVPASITTVCCINYPLFYRRWVQLKGSIEVILADVRATVAPPRVVPAELTSPVTAVDASHLEVCYYDVCDSPKRGGGVSVVWLLI